MNADAFNAIEEAWQLTVKARALCPYVSESAIGTKFIASPGWYRAHSASYVVALPKELSEDDANELREVGGFVNRSFIISMVAILEEHQVVPSGVSPDRSLNGGYHVQLVKWMRNLFAHGDWAFDQNNAKHRKTRALLEKLVPLMVGTDPGFPTPIDAVLEPLKDGVLQYIQAAT